jgi:hypothetical protein
MSWLSKKEDWGNCRQRYLSRYRLDWRTTFDDVIELFGCDHMLSIKAIESASAQPELRSVGK